MKLLGIDVGTTAVKVGVFDGQGACLASAAFEHRESHPAPGQAELDPEEVWGHVREGICAVTGAVNAAEIKALAISSMGEAVVPVSADRRILGPSILNYDLRGAEFVPLLAPAFTDERLYLRNGNTFGNQYSLTKLKWIQAHQPELYEAAWKFLHWSAFIGFMLGAEPAVDYSLANRTLLFDLEAGAWSQELLQMAGLDGGKLPRCVPSATVIGTVPNRLAQELGLPDGVRIISGAHDQCANAVGCGVIDSGDAVYGMGTYLCITPVFEQRIAASLMTARGLNTEHHAVPGKYVSFLYNQGGALVQWFRNTFAAAEHEIARQDGHSIYPLLFNELPQEPSSVLVLPHFAPTGPPEFIADSSGVISGVKLETTRGDILKGIVEGAAFYLKALVDSLPETGIAIENYRAVGGGSQSEAWVQLSADIFNRPFLRPRVTEAGALGAALIAGVGSGIFTGFHEAVDHMVKLERLFEPDLARVLAYQRRFDDYQEMASRMKGFLRD